MCAQFITKKYLLSIAIVAIVAISWFGTLDEHSDNYTNDSIIQAGVAYAIARGINGIISVLQTGTIEGGLVVSGSIAIGEILDPINDVIERFSSVMSLAIGSLALQKILLSISVHQIFKLLIIVSGIALLFSFFTRNAAATLLAIRIFLIFIFIRFSLVIVVTLNSAADEIFISSKIVNGTEELRGFRSDVVKLQNHSGGLIADQSDLEESIYNDQQKVEHINAVIMPNIKAELSNTNDQLVLAEANLETIKENISWSDRLNPFSENADENDAYIRISILEQKIDGLEEEIDDNKESLELLHEVIEDNKKRLAGESVGIFETIKDGLSTASDFKESLTLEAIEGNITDSVNNIFNLSVLFILKTILIPVAFLFIFLKGVKSIWNADFNNIIPDEEKVAAG